MSPTDLISNSDLILGGDEFHHLKNVCRLEEGEWVELLDGQGHMAQAQIVKIEKKQALLKVEAVRALPELPKPHINLVLSIPKPQTMDLIIQKAVEVGVHSITPVLSDRSFFRKKDKSLIAKLERWEKIASQACKQCGRAWPMALNEVTTLKEALNRPASEQGLFLYEGEGQVDFKTALIKMKSAPQDTLDLYIGSEGGFSLEEVEVFKQKGLQAVTLGSLVLRVETACIVAAAVIKYEFDHLR